MLLKSENSFVQITVLNRRSHNNTDYWDDNWIKSEIKINERNFNGKYNINLRTNDFQRFYLDLSNLSKGKIQEVKFTTMEEGLFLKGKLDLTGNIKWSIIAKSGEGTQLRFSMDTDNNSIKILLIEVLKVLNEYPVVGNIG